MENNLVDNLNTLHIIQKAVRLGFVFHDIQEIQDIRFAAEEFIEKNKNNSIKDIEDIKKENKKVDKNSKQEIEDNITCGIVSCVLGILSLFTGAIGIIFAIIGLICGLKNSKNAFGIIGIIVSSIYLIVFLLGALGFASIMALN